jgi:hypothetical protein
MATVSFRTDDAIEGLIGEIRGFDLEPGGMYYHADGAGSIDGVAMLLALLEQIPGVEHVVSTSDATEVTISTSAVKTFMSQSGYRAMDYDENDAMEDLAADPIGILSSMRSEFSVRVNPKDFFKEAEELPVGNPEDDASLTAGKGPIHVEKAMVALAQEQSFNEKDPAYLAESFVSGNQSDVFETISRQDGRTAASLALEVYASLVESNLQADALTFKKLFY